MACPLRQLRHFGRFGDVLSQESQESQAQRVSGSDNAAASVPPLRCSGRHVEIRRIVVQLVGCPVQ
jgi:hypothetical protein